jgi:hypothetical protein
VSKAKGFGSSHLWAVAVLVAVTLLSLTGHGAHSSQAAEDPPPDAPSDSGTSEDDAHEQEPSDEASADDASYDDSNEQGVDEGSDPEIEVEPQEEETEQPPAERDEDEDSTPPKKKKRVIGATTSVLEKQSGLLFRARVDTGSKSCSLHIEEMKIDDEAEKMVENIGKVVHFRVKNGNSKSHWLEARIAGYVIIKTSDSRVRRYKVPLTLRWKGIEKTVLVTLNNRSGMKYPLMLGRNFLRGDFLVDVDIDNDD